MARTTGLSKTEEVEEEEMGEEGEEVEEGYAVDVGSGVRGSFFGDGGTCALGRDDGMTGATCMMVSIWRRGSRGGVGEEQRKSGKEQGTRSSFMLSEGEENGRRGEGEWVYL